MTHLDEGALQAYLDGETTGRERVVTAEHLLACEGCRGQLETLRRANERFATALAALDVPPPAAAPRRALSARGRIGVGGGSMVRAAVLVLLLAAAASASVPGSPVRDWIGQVVGPAEPVAEAPAVDPPRPPSGAVEPAGISVPGVRDMDVLVTGMEGATIRLVRTGASGVSVSARGGERDPLFRLGSGRIEVVGAIGGELRIEVPEGAGLRLFVNDRPYAEVADGDLRVLEPGEREGKGVVWR